ncbi:MAG: dienelactone hydrolase family protein [Acidimicrobiales bacterium]|nr:dienelactone hydrolase family protein [Acidimicrobiales bacterium]
MTEIALPYFLALPAAAPPWPGVVVLHEGNGISPQLLRVCQRLAGEGYATIAPDLFFRAGGTEAGDFATLIGSLDRDRTRADIVAASDHLRREGATSVGVTGFCMGGLLTYRAALAGDGFDAAVGFYGAGIAAELGEPACPTLLMFGEEDAYITPAEIEMVRDRHPATVVYPEAGHGFMRDGSNRYNQAASVDAWSRMLRFFTEQLL